MTNLTTFGLPAIVALGAIYSAGELTRRRFSKPAFPLDGWSDHAGAENVYVEMIGNSKRASSVLEAIARHPKPIAFDELMEALNTKRRDVASDRGLSPAGLHAVLGIFLVTRIVRMRAGGFCLTEMGHDVHRRICREGENPRPGSSSTRLYSSIDRPNTTIARSGVSMPVPRAANGASRMRAVTSRGSVIGAASMNYMAL